ncbi:helix-turn-helix transcriptional regulator [Amycolatopsis jiangsuensis]|uniref:DNA-binding CsgD family transcriptional regulator n=1 Tax=Amycolatopsis jiangsuensis TaxID=1181879 RepID=A0A840J683_9PSEU|nr:helix-turn-helix transcriptional regulator [Amycolatopsis jiangsuensis]MBB4688918.1 DNA-binding CsgD family transcriptional regulator [Amycolatopsis jiangsuensis]
MGSSGRLALAASPLVAGAMQALQRATGLPVAMGGPVSAGSRTLVIDQLRGTATGSLQHLRVDTGAGLGGKAVALARPSTVIDYLSAQGITHKYDRAVAPEQLRAIVALPVRVSETTRAVLYAATRESITFGDRILRAAHSVVARLERDIEVEEEIRRRLAEPSPSALGEQDDLRAELLAIAGSIQDGSARQRLLAVCERLHPAPAPPGGPLTPREIDVLRLAGEGCTNEDISTRLGLLPNTVKSYLKHAMRKLDAANRVQAVNRARAAGLLH